MYPSLPDFMRSILVNSVSGNLSQDAWNALPPGLPLMTFLSRVQPIKISGSDAASHTLPMVAPLIDGLSHKHIAVRNGAARAISNMACGGDDSMVSALSLLRWCRARLSASESSLNQTHGVLCLVRELLKAHVELLGPCSAEGVPSLLVEKIDEFVSGRKMPPLVIAAAFEVLHLTTSEDTLDKCQTATVAWLESEPYEHIGTAELGSIVGVGSCKHLLPLIWGTNNPDSYDERKLADLLSSVSFDVRAAAIKTFKKSIYEGVDGLIALCSDGAPRLESIRLILMKTLTSELGGQLHPPNVRRLSRCLLECLSAQRRLSQACTMEPTEQDKLWRIASTMASYNSANENSQHDYTAIDGNAVELMSFVVCEGSRSDEDLRLFASLVDRLSDPYLPWRLRHSSAVAIATSGLLCLDIEDSSETITCLRHDLVARALQFCQDSDADVRHAASFSLMSRVSPERMSMTTSEHTLHTALSPATASNNLFRIDDAIRITLEFTDTLENAMEAFMNEFSRLGGSSETGLLNMGTGRKIFEEEAPNDYMEMALPIQLMVHNLSTNDFFLPAPDQDAARLVLDRCESVLSLLCQSHPDNEVFEVTSDRKVMPALHSLLLVSAVLIDRINGYPVDLPVLADKASQQVLHPLVRQVLDVIRDAASHPAAIVDCCFLHVANAYVR